MGFTEHEILYNFLICFDTTSNFIDRVGCGDFFVSNISLGHNITLPRSIKYIKMTCLFVCPLWCRNNFIERVSCGDFFVSNISLGHNRIRCPGALNIIRGLVCLSVCPWSRNNFIDRVGCGATLFVISQQWNYYSHLFSTQSTV